MMGFLGYLDKALWLAGFGHFLVLVASVQVPSRLGWREDLSKLSRFNRKLFWTYAVYIFGMIFSFGVLTVFLHDDLMAGGRPSLGLTILIAIFWGVRIAIDIFYFSHADWPQGIQFRIGHFFLTVLFIFLCSTYTLLALWHVVLK